MSGSITFDTDLRREWRRNTQRLDTVCRQRLGISIGMFRTFKFLFYLAVIGFAGYLTEFQGVEPLITMAFTALLISGPEGVEAFLVRQDVIADSGEE